MEPINRLSRLKLKAVKNFDQISSECVISYCVYRHPKFCTSSAYNKFKQIVFQYNISWVKSYKKWNKKK